MTHPNSIPDPGSTADVFDEMRTEQRTHPDHGYDQTHDDTKGPVEIVIEARRRLDNFAFIGIPTDERQQLVIAGSLIGAALNTLDRASSTPEGTP